MELLSKDITLGFYNDTGIINLPVPQYDAGRVISIGLTNDGKRFEIPENTAVFLKAIKPNGKQVNTDEWCSICDNKVVIEVARQLSAVPGTVECELILGDNTGKQYTSSRFNIVVGKAVHNDENLTSTDTYKNILDILLELDGLKKDLVFKKEKDQPGGIPSLDDQARIPRHELYAADLNSKGIVKLVDSVQSDSTADAATPNSVRIVNETLQSHTADTDNPHTVTKEQIGLENVDNTADANKPVSTAQQEAINASYQNAKAYTDTHISNKEIHVSDEEKNLWNQISGIDRALQEIDSRLNEINLAHDILNTTDAVIGNTVSGKLVDALVIKELFQSVSNGKELLASAITNKGIPTDVNESFSIMSEKIGMLGNHTHHYSESITKDPSYTTEGEKTYQCTCGNSYIEVLPKLEKLDGEIRLSETSGTIIAPSSHQISVIANRSGGILSAISSNENIATVSVEGTTITIISGTSDGTATITVKSASTEKYKEATTTYLVTNITVAVAPDGELQERWQYILNGENVILTKYKADITTLTKYKTIVVYAKYPLNGKIYNTKLTSQSHNLFNGISPNNNANVYKLTFNKGIDYSEMKSTSGMFTNSRIDSIIFNDFDTSNVTDMTGMFKKCIIGSLNLSSFDTSKVTSMSEMFCGAQNLTSLNMSGWNTSNVLSMSYMFYNLFLARSLDLSSFDMRKVVSADSMFEECINLSTLKIPAINLRDVTNTSRMFYRCKALNSLDFSNAASYNNNYMNEMFCECVKLSYVNLSGFHTSHVTDMSNMFDGCTYLASLDLTTFDTANVTKINYMFNNCKSLTKIYVSRNLWIIGDNCSDTGMFNGCHITSVTYR